MIDLDAESDHSIDGDNDEVAREFSLSAKAFRPLTRSPTTDPPNPML